ncbi:MAG: sulfite exporter TauE/SafE family protein [bacterium]
MHAGRLIVFIFVMAAAASGLFGYTAQDAYSGGHGHGHKHEHEHEDSVHGDMHDHSETIGRVEKLIMDIKEGRSTAAFVVILLTMVFYGMLHGLGLGHGNAVISGWILSSDQRLRSVITAALLTPLFHIAVASVVVAAAWAIMNQTVSQEKINEYMRIISGSMVLLIGIYLMVSFFIERAKHKRSCCHGGTPDIIKKEMNPVFVAVGAGFVPCPITSVILLTALGLDMLYKGIILVIALGAGMAVTFVLVAYFVWYAKEKAVNALAGRTAEIIDIIIHIAGAAVVLFMGIYLLYPFFTG